MSARVAYLTDIHLREKVEGTSKVRRRKCREMAGLLPKALERLSGLSPDLLVCTGDVVDDPDGQGVMEDLAYCKRCFDDCGIPYLVLPGNHDPAPSDFYHVFPRPQRSVMVNGCELVLFHEDVCVEGELSSCRSDLLLDEMARGLAKTSGDAKMVLMFQHYVVYPDCNERYPHNYQNDGEIRKILECADRKILSVSGHYHPGIALIEKNGVSYFAGRAFCEKPYSYYIINASEDRFSIEAFGIEKECD